MSIISMFGAQHITNMSDRPSSLCTILKRSSVRWSSVSIFHQMIESDKLLCSWMQVISNLWKFAEHYDPKVQRLQLIKQSIIWIQAWFENSYLWNWVNLSWSWELILGLLMRCQNVSVLRTLVIPSSHCLGVQQNTTLANMPAGLGRPSLCAILIKEIFWPLQYQFITWPTQLKGLSSNVNY